MQKARARKVRVRSVETLTSRALSANNSRLYFLIQHSGCLIEYDSVGFEWLSFMPKSTFIFDVFPGGNYGWIDNNDRETAIDTYARFVISENILVKGRNNTVADYLSAN